VTEPIMPVVVPRATSGLEQLSSDLIALLCSFLDPSDALLCLSRASSTTAHILTPACFTSTGERGFVLSDERMQRLAERTTPLPALLSGSCSGVFIRSGEARMAPGLPPLVLSRFTAVGSFELSGVSTQCEQDGQLVSMLQATLSQPALQTTERVRVDGWSPGESDVYHYELDVGRLRFPRLRRWDWAQEDVRCRGAEELLTAHDGVVELGVTPDFFSGSALASLLRSTSALPLLDTLRLYDSFRINDEDALILRALTEEAPSHSSSRPRPVTRLMLSSWNSKGASTAALHAARSLPLLRELSVTCCAADWPVALLQVPQPIEAWSRLSAFKQNTREAPAAPPATKTTQDRQREWEGAVAQLSRCPLRELQLEVPEPLTLSSAVLDSLAALPHLRSLTLSRPGQMGMVAEPHWPHDDWSEPALLLSRFPPSHFPALLQLHLHVPVKFSAAGLVALLRACPALRSLELLGCDLDMDPVVACVLVGLCKDVRRINLCALQSRDPECRHGHEPLTAATVVDAAAAHSVTAANFVHLSFVQLFLCPCLSAEVWHALFSFFRSSTRLTRFHYLRCTEPMKCVALRFLPRLEGFCWRWTLGQASPLRALLVKGGYAKTDGQGVHPHERGVVCVTDHLYHYTRSGVCTFRPTMRQRAGVGAIDGRSAFFRDVAERLLSVEEQRQVAQWEAELCR
jgi:hypothetical protein